jgi:hypothetical protein
MCRPFEASESWLTAGPQVERRPFIGKCQYLATTGLLKR